MARELKLRRGNTAQHSAFIGAEAEITINIETKSVRVHDGVSAGGFDTARADLNNVSNGTFAAKAAAAGVTGGGGGNSVVGADANATYLLVNLDATLPNERRFQSGDGILTVDGGAGGGFVVSARLANTGAPSNLGSANLGVSNSIARADHVHAMPTATDVGAVPNNRVIKNGTGISVSNSGLLTANTTISLTASVGDLTDVVITSPQNNNMLIYNGGSSRWENTPFATFLTVRQSNVVVGAANAINNINFLGNGVTVVADTDTKKLNVTIDKAFNTEEIQDIIGDMVTANTETGITVTYDDGTGKLNFVVTGAGDSTSLNGYTTAKPETGNTIVVRETTGAINATRYVANSTAPSIAFKATSASPNTGKWLLGSDNTTFQLWATNDLDVAQSVLTINRNSSASTAASVKFAVTDNVYITKSGVDYPVLSTSNLNNATFVESVEDIAAALLTSGTHTGVTVVYDDATAKINLTVTGGGGGGGGDATTLQSYAAADFVRKAEANATVTANWRFSGDLGLDAGKALYFGAEELFGGTNTGTNDYGYIRWDNDNNTYAISSSSSENGCLRIGVLNDGVGSNGDSIAIEPSADLFLNPGGAVYIGNAVSRQKVWHEGNDGASSLLDADMTDGYHATTAATANTIAVRDSTNTIYATIFNGTATAARYADVAERYSADAIYEPGSVVVFGGTAEITLAAKSHDTAVAGVISTAPAYMMNSEAGSDETHPYVALVGRVPCKVIGPITKGDLLTTSEYAGHAKRVISPVHGAIVGKALESFDGSVGVIEISVQRS